MTPYRAPWWLPGGHLQTIYPALALRRGTTRLERERWTTPDGDFIDVDWRKRIADAPLVVLFHGLEGSARGHYASSLLRALDQRGWNGAIVHFRGCSGEPNRLPRAYHSGDSAEIDWILRRFRNAHAGPLFAVGVSLGGNALLKWLGEQAVAASTVLSAAAAVSTPFDLTAAGTALDRGLNQKLYTRHFLRSLKQKALAKSRCHSGLPSAAALRAIDTLHAFDDLYTAPFHGYADADDYWRRASSKPWLRHIKVATLLINARNDPFLPAAALPRSDELSRAIEADFPDQGGHAGFVSSPFPGTLDWLPQRITAFFARHVSTARMEIETKTPHNGV